MSDTDQVDRGYRASYGHVDDAGRMSAEEMDEKRKQNIAYEYLCHLEEAKVWIQACINEELPPTTELEDGLQNGVYLAKLGHFMAHDVVPLKKIYDKDQERWKTRGLHFRHTDNINHFFRGMEKVGLPKIFYPETTDIYDKKNMPKVIYCIHALSLYLFKLGLAPQIEDLYGKIKFTDEEISAMRKELEKYGIQMPAFSKIGGILANEMPVDEAALHAAVIAINEAVDKQDPSETLTSLRNPAAHLINIVSEHADDYQDLMYVAKHTKAENAHNKSVDLESTWEPDVYDELLTQAEIQGNINKVNAHRALVLVNAALDSGNSNLLLEALQSSHLSLKGVKVDNAEVYMGRLRNEREQKQKSHGDPSLHLDKDELQLGINKANLDADVDYQKKLAVDSVNTALKKDDATDLMRALQSSSAHFPAVCDFAGALYLEEFQSILQEKGDDLEFDEIVGGITVLSAIARINGAVQAGQSEETFRSLQQEGAHIASLDETSMDKYQNQLFQDMLAKAKLRNPLLTHLEIQEAIDTVNTRVTEEHERIEAIAKINEAIDNGDDEATLATLQLPSAKLQNINSNQAVHYQAILAHDKAKKTQISGDESDLLWLEEIQSAVDRSNKHADDAVKMAVNVADINLALDTNDAERLLTLLQNNDVFLHSVTGDCAEEYYERLQQKKAEKAAAGDTGSGWMMNRTKEGHKFYFNVQTMESGWTRGPSIVKDNELLTREEIQSMVTEITADYDRELLFKANEPFIIQVQALIRGHLARKKFQERLNFMRTQLPAIVAIQSCWRGYKQRKQYQDRLDMMKSNEPAVVKLQAAARMWQARKKYKERKKFYKENEDKIVKIQACFRSNMARNDYVQLMHADDPPVSVVRKFVHLLDQSDIDYSEEIEIQNLRKKVVTVIRSNQQLENDLDTMDIKIGLLVKNRITLQDVVSHDMKLKHYKDESAKVQQQRGLKALSKESRERVNSYQHLFYLLQTNPTYLAKLIFEMPHDRSTKFMESLVLTLYNYGSNTREEYLLLKLFKTALEEEINSRVETMTDIVTGNPMVVKMVVGFNRNARGQSYLREMLNPLVKSVMDDRSLKINTNPTEVYKAWVNQTESETGQASGLPYDVTIEQALSHEEVRKRSDQSVQELRNTTDKFLQHILQSLDKIPYGMRYIAKVMKSALETKFPEAVEKDILKIVGNLLYYRYINSAIVSPDAFDIIDISAEKKTLTNDQRRNLGSIAKILQFAASNKGFGGESQHLACLNPYIREAHDKFKNYFRLACEVEEPEVRFNVDEFTDATMVTKPVIYISIKEIVDLHQLLYEHQDSIATDEKDPLHELMEDLGDVPSIEELVGEMEVGDEQMQEQARANMAKIEISLTLTNKFEVPDDDHSDLKSMLIRTKRMVVDVIRCQPGDNLTNILITTATDGQEKLHAKLNKTRDEIDGRAKSRKAQLVRQQSMIGDRQLPLESMKKNIRKNLGVLENASIVSRKDNYQAIINMIVQDIRNQRRYRQRRKQELIRLRSALDSLDTKRKFYEEQIDYYNKYVKTCMDNLQQKGKKAHRRSWFNWKEASGTKVTSVKYNGEKLYERGVLLEIDGLPTNQFKNVLFEISATEDSGVFDVAVKYVGVSMDKVELVFQDLLQLQYEGVAVMKMFQRAKVNVNLLIFLLNKKFYGKRV